MLSLRLDETSDGRAHRRASRRPATRRAAGASLLLAGGLLAGSLSPAATADVLADTAPISRAQRTSELSVTRDVGYAEDPVLDPALKLDVYKKVAGKTKRPAVVLIHGGGWIDGDDPDDGKGGPRVVNPARDLAKNGYVAIVIDYPGATDTISGTTMEEDAVERAADWAIANSAEYGIKPGKIAFIGGSSGGQLSLLAAFKANQAAPGKITMAYSLSGPVDLWKDIAALRAGTADPAVDEGPPGYRNIELYLGCDWELEAPVRRSCTEAEAKAVSPLFYPADSTCPLVRITRAVQEKHAEADLLDANLFEAGCRVDPEAEPLVDPQVIARHLPGKEHGFAQWDIIGDELIADLNTYMKPAPPPPPPPPGLD